MPILGLLVLVGGVVTAFVSRPAAQVDPCPTGYGSSYGYGDLGSGYGYGYGYTCTPPSGGGGGGGGGGVPATTTTTSNTTTTTPTGQPNSVAGSNREGTAIAASQLTFPGRGSAKVVLLARDDLYPDAETGGRLAVVKDGPLLLTPPSALDPATEAEIQRVLPAGGTVFILGGTDAVSDAVANKLISDGFNVVRLGGIDRFATAMMIANEETSSSATSGAGAHIATVNSATAPILIATGFNFPDGLASSAAASAIGGTVLLSNGTAPSSATTSYIQAHPGAKVYAIGGPAAVAYPTATAIVGADRYATAAMVASQFFSQPKVVGIATGAQFPERADGRRGDG